MLSRVRRQLLSVKSEMLRQGVRVGTGDRLRQPQEPIASISPGTRRRGYLQALLPISRLSILEVGAFDQPTYLPGDVDVEYFDRFDPAELAEKYGHVETRTVSAAVRPDYVSKEKRFASAIDRRFDLVIANHVLEHAADPLTWLEQLAEVTMPGGHLFMALPDRRYTFDILRRESTLSDWLRWRELDLEKPCADQLFDAIYYHRPVRHMDVWLDRVSSKLGAKRFPADDAWRRAKYHATEAAPDSHCSVFTSETFRLLWSEVEELGSPWRWVDCEDVVAGSNEFLVLLSRREPIEDLAS